MQEWTNNKSYSSLPQPILYFHTPFVLHFQHEHLYIHIIVHFATIYKIVIIYNASLVIAEYSTFHCIHIQVSSHTVYWVYPCHINSLVYADTYYSGCPDYLLCTRASWQKINYKLPSITHDVDDFSTALSENGVERTCPLVTGKCLLKHNTSLKPSNFSNIL